MNLESYGIRDPHSKLSIAFLYTSNENLKILNGTPYSSIKYKKNLEKKNVKDLCTQNYNISLREIKADYIFERIEYTLVGKLSIFLVSVLH